MLLHFQKWWNESLNPDIYASWNGEKYDFPYLLERLKKYNLSTVMGRFPMIALESPWEQLQQQREQNIEEIEDDSEQDQETKEKTRVPNIKFHGRIPLDGLKWFRRFAKANSYRLKEIVENFVLTKEEKAFLVEEKKQDEKKQIEEDTPEWIEQILLNPKYKGKKDLDYEKIGPYFVTSPLHRLAILIYCLFDAIYAWRCVRDTNFVDIIFQIMNLTSADFHRVQERGQQILVYHRLLPPLEAGHYVINRHDWNQRGSKYQGGFVPIPRPGQHCAVLILDFKSLYPSCMVQFGLSYDTFIMNEAQRQTALRLGYKIEVIDCRIDESNATQKTNNKTTPLWLSSNPEKKKRKRKTKTKKCF